MPEWLKGTGCKPVGLCLRRFESYSLHQNCGSSSIGRVSAFQAEGCGFETRLPLQFFTLVLSWCKNGKIHMCLAVEYEVSPCGSGVEHTLGKGEVASSSLAMGSSFVRENESGKGSGRKK